MSWYGCKKNYCKIYISQEILPFEIIKPQHRIAQFNLYQNFQSYHKICNFNAFWRTIFKMSADDKIGWEEISTFIKLSCDDKTVSPLFGQNYRISDLIIQTSWDCFHITASSFHHLHHCIEYCLFPMPCFNSIVSFFSFLLLEFYSPPLRVLNPSSITSLCIKLFFFLFIYLWFFIVSFFSFLLLEFYSPPLRARNPSSITSLCSSYDIFHLHRDDISYIYSTSSNAKSLILFVWFNTMQT